MKRPPEARKVSTERVHEGRRIVDEYAWLRERSNPEVMAYLRAENDYVEAACAATADLREELYREMVGRIRESDRSVPVRRGPYVYYTRTIEAQQYAVHCRSEIEEGPEQVLLDENELAKDVAYFRLGALSVSPDHRLLAYAFDTEGDESYTLRFLDIEKGELLEDEVRGVYTSVEWAADNRTVFYSVLDAAHRPHRLMRHRIDRPDEADRLVFEEPDEAFFLDLYKTKDRRFLILRLESNNTTQLHALEADRMEEPFRPIVARRPGIECTAEHRDGRFLFLTNEGAVNFRLVQAPVATPGVEHWEELLPHRPSVKLDGIDVFSRHVAVTEREEGLRGLRIIDVESGAQHRLEFPEPVYTVWTHGNPEHDTSRLRFTYSSPVTPDSVFDYDMDSRVRELRKKRPVLGDFRSEDYRCERLWARAADGTRVPISVVYREPLDRDGLRPLLLYGYGAYGISSDPSFDSNRLSLLDRGVVWAIAHVRGGGEMGRPWYEAGKLRDKRNSFDDFIACAEHLVEEGITSPERLAIRGGSAGGLLVGAVANLRPDLFRAVVADVPFVDVVNTMLDPSLPLSVIEREEWGDPRRPDVHDFMLSYSPYEGIRGADYPAMLITAGLHDPRVSYWEPAKWAARLRAKKTDDRILLLKTDLGAGHAGPSGRYDRLREVAFRYAFVLRETKATAESR